MSATDGSDPGGRPDAAHRAWPAEPRVLSDIRDTIRGWLGEIELTPDVRDDLIYATSEAASNAVEHAYRTPDATSTVAVTMWSEPGVVNIEIADRGCWMPPSTEPTTRGHGLQLIRGLVDTVSVDSRSGGTTVSLRHPVPGASALRVVSASGR